MIPVFTTSNPGFMADSSDVNEEFIATIREKQHFIGFEGKPWITVYYHGDLEDELGYDIPVWVGGDICNDTKQEVRVYSRDGDKHFIAVMHMEKRGHLGTPEGFDDHYKGVITLTYDQKENLEWLL